MTNTYRNKRDVRRWSVGAALAAAGATMLGTAGLAVAHADDGAATDIGLLTTAQTDATEALTALNQLAAGEPVSTGFVGVIDKVADVQTPLLSSDNSLISGVGGLLFNGPDQQLAQSAETFLTAAQTYVADPASLTNAFDALSTSFQFDGALVGLVPSADIGKIIEQVLDISGSDTGGSAGAATDLASSAANTPDGVLGEAVTVLNQGSAVLATASTADLSTRAADVLSTQETLTTQLDTSLATSASLQDMLSAGDQTLVADVDEQLVSAAQNLLTADQGFVAADQAGELSSSGINAPELAVIGADLQLFGADFDAVGASILAAFTGGLDVSSTADLASTLDPTAAVDPSIFADLLSSIGF